MITRVPGLLVGHLTDPRARTGCTVVLCPPRTVGSGAVRGGAPGTRETDLLRPGTLVDEVHAVVLSGGSAFGLASADGVMRWLEERGIGFDVGGIRVPIVPAAILFDLGVGDPMRRPGPDDGYAACDAASELVEEGSVGAGTGATVAKLEGPDRAVPGGLGTASVEGEGGLVVGALAAVNALGEIVDDDGTVIAGARPARGSTEPEATGEAAGAEEAGRAEGSGLGADAGGFEEIIGGLGDGANDEAVDDGQEPLPGMNTTLVVVATNGRLSKERAHLLALAGHEGLARAVHPSHTIWDGDTVFSLATGEVEASQPEVERLAADATAEAIRRAVRLADPLLGTTGEGGG